MAKYFITDWNYKLTPEFIKEVCKKLQENNQISVASLSVFDYFQGIQKCDFQENGLYFICFQDNNFYIGKAGSCTLLERLAKHFDGRKAGSFNGLLKKIGPDLKNSLHFSKNQEVFLDATILFLPINLAKLIAQNTKLPLECAALHHLERDTIALFQRSGFPVINRKINYFSGFFLD